jgi:hypothetical protein
METRDIDLVTLLTILGSQDASGPLGPLTCY